MNFAFDSVKPKSKVFNEDFYFDFATPRGHCFIVLDFVSHDYANLNATLTGKLDTIVGSFVTLPSFSPELFLGFVAKEINNFIHHLAEQAGGPELLCSGALCFLTDDALSYFVRGNTQVNLINDGRLLPFPDPEGGTSQPPLGKGEIEAPTDEVKTSTVADTDQIVVMTQSVAETIEPDQLLVGLDAQSICNELIEGSAKSSEDRTVLVISGPYVLPADAGLAQKFGDELNSLREEVQGKAGTIALLELGGKIDSLAAAVAGKADNAELLELKRDVLRFGLNKKADEEKPVQSASPVEAVAPAEGPQRSSSSPLLTAAVVALLVSLAAGFLGGWFYSRSRRTSPEVWSVKSSGNQVSITRQNGATVVLDLAKPLKATGEQTFSSFAEVKSYLDTINAPENSSAQVSNAPEEPKQTSEAAVTEVIVKPGDSLKRFALHYNVPQERIMQLNPNITRWPYIKAGQKVLIPVPAAPSPTPAITQPSSQSGR
ncbi:MAG TPA: LysM peptidoglycan-binding domain-containing protein [Pyrinomonadaceae bacterium]|nr:LysM peptidoglycan-binding domain-containing protein [Pyrinomonadaceae bacterium]